MSDLFLSEVVQDESIQEGAFMVKASGIDSDRSTSRKTDFLKSFNGNDPFTIKAIFHVFPKRIVKTFVHREFYKILNIFRCPGAQWIDPGRRPSYCSGGQQSGDLPCSHLQAP